MFETLMGGAWILCSV